MLKPLFIAAALAVVPATAARAEEPVPATAAQDGPQIDAPAPVFSATTQAGESVDLAAISGAEGAVIVFSRSLDWCPYCKGQAIELETIADDMQAAGWPLSLITYDTPETLTAFGADKGLTYTLLSDDGSAMIDAFGLRNHDVPAGSRFDGIPHPAIVFVDTGGTVRAVLREEGYKVRPQPAEIIATAAALNGADATD